MKILVNKNENNNCINNNNNNTTTSNSINTNFNSENVNCLKNGNLFCDIQSTFFSRIVFSHLMKKLN